MTAAETRPRPRPHTRLARAERREQIIDAAGTLLYRRDANTVTFEEIADAAGVSRALVYNYFGDRHGLIEAMYGRSIDELDRRVGETLSATRGLREAMHASVHVHLAYALEDPASYRRAAGEIPFPRLAELEAERVGRLAKAFGGGHEATVLARAMLSAIHGVVLWWLDGGTADIDGVADAMSAFLNGGVAALVGSGVRITPTWPVPA